EQPCQPEVDREDSRPTSEHGEQLTDGGVDRLDESRQLVEHSPYGARIGKVFRGGRAPQFVANPRDRLIVQVKAQLPEEQSVGEDGDDEQEKRNRPRTRSEG